VIHSLIFFKKQCASSKLSSNEFLVTDYTGKSIKYSYFSSAIDRTNFCSEPISLTNFSTIELYFTVLRSLCSNLFSSIRASFWLRSISRFISCIWEVSFSKSRTKISLRYICCLMFYSLAFLRSWDSFKSPYKSSTFLIKVILVWVKSSHSTNFTRSSLSSFKFSASFSLRSYLKVFISFFKSSNEFWDSSYY